MATLDRTEFDFEAMIVGEMVGQGWLEGDPSGYDAELGLYCEDAIGYIAETQSKEWARLVKQYATEDQARKAVLKRLASQLDRRGAIDVLRKGFSERGVTLRLCQFEPAHALSEKVVADFEANRLRVVRQVRFDPKGGDSVDLVLFVNGIPTATAELKNRWTGQNVNDAEQQYREDRDPRIVLFARRAFVHFAVDSQLALMTTRLARGATRFLPFNQGSGGAGQPGGEGNPPMEDGHPTSYLWREVWDPDRWLQIIERFVHVEPSEDPRKPDTIIFPRYHQWHVVVESHTHARVHGPGNNYLIQHSAGSGKTKEIAWLAHDLASLHDEADHKVFDQIIVITDRRNLDKQLQDQIQQFAQVEGVVRAIDRNSSQLRETLVGGKVKIVVSTLQKFPVVLKALEGEEAGLADRSYAVIVDEAHSSQTGESAADLKALLGARTAEDLDLDEDDTTPLDVLARLAARGPQPNISFFAFTATPKARTLEQFGTRRGGTLQAFHTYSMKQAIEEGYIVDVLRNYTTYEQLYRLASKADEELEVPKGKAASRLRQYAQFHPYAKDQKAAIVVEHFRDNVRKLLGGTAKAMVVTASREEAVQWKLALDKQVAEQGADDVEILVAFSGEVTIRHPEAPNLGQSYTEPEMNILDGRPLPERRLPDEFAKDEYGILVVAEKYQTGFDEPRLCAMYVDKPLVGVNAVQTLSRLNRAFPHKDEVYVVDFVNDADAIRAEFERFFWKTEALPTDPNALFDAAQQALDAGIITQEDLDAFAVQLREVEQRKLAGASDPTHHLQSTLTDDAFYRWWDSDEAAMRTFADDLSRFTRYYSFLSQVLSYVPPETEMLFQFGKILLARMDMSEPSGGVSLAGVVEMTHYRLEEVATERISLGEVDVEPVEAIIGDGTGPSWEQGEIPIGPLSELVEAFNSRFGTDLSEADALVPLLKVSDVMVEDETLAAQANANDFEDFRRGKDQQVVAAALDAQDQLAEDRDRQDDLLRHLLDDEDFRAIVSDVVLRSAYERLRGSDGV
jgi:type I restriction enzyme R subunit